MFGGIGAGHEREAVISVAAGKILRYLSPPPGSQSVRLFSPDRHTVYEFAYGPKGDFGPDSHVCGQKWRAIDVASGRISSAFDGADGIAEFAFSPDGSKLALVRQKKHQPVDPYRMWALTLFPGAALTLFSRVWPSGEFYRVTSLPVISGRPGRWLGR